MSRRALCPDCRHGLWAVRDVTGFPEAAMTARFPLCRRADGMTVLLHFHELGAENEIGSYHDLDIECTNCPRDWERHDLIAIYEERLHKMGLR